MALDELKNWFNEFRTNWKRAVLYLIVIILILIGGTYVKTCVSEKAKIYATSEKTVTSKKETILESEKPQKKDNIKFQTLNEYFRTDFSYYLTVNQWMGIKKISDASKAEEKNDYDLEFRLHCDFESLTKFISFYLPSSTFPNTVPICKVVAEQIHEIGNSLTNRVFVAGSRYGDRMTEIDDLKFTSRVYIYHDAYISDDEKDELRLFYKQKNLDPRFRGSNYVMMRK